jgi:putative SOS response-associated peptidase YedK
MPALLAERDYDALLSGTAGVELLKPAPDDRLQRWPASKRVNGSKAAADDPTLIDPLAA